VHFANSNPAFIEMFCSWFRRFFEVDESRLRVTPYLHEHLDLVAAVHVHGCCHVRYHSTRELRRILGLIDGLILISSRSVSPG